MWLFILGFGLSCRLLDVQVNMIDVALTEYCNRHIRLAEVNAHAKSYAIFCGRTRRRGRS
jgi:hypothetical protein